MTLDPATYRRHAIHGERQRVPARRIHLIPLQFYRHTLFLDENGVSDCSGALAGFFPEADQYGGGGWRECGHGDERFEEPEMRRNDTPGGIKAPSYVVRLPAM